MDRARDHQPARTLALACLLLGAWGWILLGPLYLQTLWPPPDEVTDFYQDWGSARNHQVGLPVYTAHSVSIPRHLGLPGNPNPSIEYNAHPPGAVLLVMPFASLSYRDALLLWNLGSLAFVVVSLIIVALELPARRSWFWLVWACLPFCQPLYANMRYGQLTPILLLLTTGAWALERRQRDSAAGMVLGIAAAIKLFPAYLLVYFVARGRVRVVLAAIVAFIAWNAVAAVLLGPDSFREYIETVLPHMEAFRGFGFNLSISGFWHKLFNTVGEPGWVPPLGSYPMLARLGSLASILIMTAITALISYRARTPIQRDLAFSAALTGMLLASPVTWVYSLMLLVVPLAVLARNVDERGWIRSRTLVLAAAVLAIPQHTWTALTVGEQPTSATLFFTLGPTSVRFYGILAIFVMLTVVFWSDQSRLHEPQNQIH
jgi:hypothetical protein